METLIAKRLISNDKLRQRLCKGVKYQFTKDDKKVEIYMDSSERYIVLLNGSLRSMGYSLSIAIQFYNDETIRL